MFEFEMKGSMDDLINLEKDLCEHLGFGKASEFPIEDYDVISNKYKTEELEHEHEMLLDQDYGNVFLLKNFPNTTSPFWNMKQAQDGKHAKKVDVIIHGVETIGSATFI